MVSNPAVFSKESLRSICPNSLLGLFNEILVTPGSTFFTVLVTGLIIFLAFVRFLITGIGNAARLLSILSLWLTASLASTPALANPIAGCNAANSVIATPIGLPIFEVPFLTTCPQI